MAGYTRQIKHGFFLNEEIARLAYQWRLLFIGLWTIADREGRIEDRPSRIKAALFAYDDRVDIEIGLTLLTDARLITRYEVNGVRVIAIPTWERHQRPHPKELASGLPAMESRVWKPDTQMISTYVRSSPDSCTGDQDPDRTSDQVVVRTKRARFELFWTAYPRKVGKEAAWAVWERLNPTEALTAQIITAIEQQRTSPQWLKDGGQFIPHPRTWLQQGRWQDEPDQQPYLSNKSVEVLRGLGRLR